MIAPNTLLTIPDGTAPGHPLAVHLGGRSTRFRRVNSAIGSSRLAGSGSMQLTARSQTPLPFILVAHSLGCIAVAHWAASRDVAAVASALLWRRLAARFSLCPQELRSFLPAPNSRLPSRPSWLPARTILLAYRPCVAPRPVMGSEFVNVGLQGHINVASGHGPWPAGEASWSASANPPLRPLIRPPESLASAKFGEGRFMEESVSAPA